MIGRISMHLLWCAVEKSGDQADRTESLLLREMVYTESNGTEQSVSKGYQCRSVTSQSGSHGHYKPNPLSLLEIKPIRHRYKERHIVCASSYSRILVTTLVCFCTDRKTFYP
jgi:hypothetical protein